MKQKLIMENWRKFIESISLEEIDQKYESQLEEGLGTTLLTLVTFIVGGQKVELDKAEQTLAYGMMNKIEQQGDTYSGVPVEDIRSAFDDYMEAAQGSDYNGDGISDKDIRILEKTKGNAPDIIVGQLFQYVDGKGPTEQPQQDTGDTGLSSQETLNISVAINQMDLAHTRGDKKARNKWAQSILDYNEQNGGVPNSVISRAEFFVGK